MNEDESTPTGIISKSLTWIFHPSFSDADPVDWFGFLIVFILVGLLWSKVLRQLIDN